MKKLINFKTWLEQDRFIDDGEGNIFWGNEASGVLPIAEDTKFICLSLRSANVSSRIRGRTVHQRCWGTFGGAMQEGETSENNAINELKEETGYNGPIKMIPAFVFSSGSFKYYNFIGLVPQQNNLGLNPMSGYSGETDAVEWFAYDDLEGQSSIKGIPFHDGLVALLNNSKNLIERLVL